MVTINTTSHTILSAMAGAMEAIKDRCVRDAASMQISGDVDRSDEFVAMFAPAPEAVTAEVDRLFGVWSEAASMHETLCRGAISPRLRESTAAELADEWEHAVRLERNDRRARLNPFFDPGIS